MDEPSSTMGRLFNCLREVLKEIEGEAIVYVRL